MNIKEVVEKTTQFFKDKKIESPRLDAELLIAGALKIKRIDLYLKFDQPLKENEISACRDFVKRRSLGEPVAYILGYKDFYGYTFKVNPNVLIPRPETEILVEQAEKWLAANNIQAPKILDLGSGSGCVGLSIVKRLSGSKTADSVLTKPMLEPMLVSVDISNEALDVTKENSTLLGINDRVIAINKNAADLMATDFKNDDTHFDIIVANPPYIAKNDPNIDVSVRKFEPSLALFAEDDGYAEIKAWLKTAINLVNSKSIVLFEIGYNQGPTVVKLFVDSGAFTSVELIKDLAGHDRVIKAEVGGN